MATISGVNISLITSIGGVDITSISNIAGISTSNIPGWPTGASCTTVYYGYSDGGRNPPRIACTEPRLPYELDVDISGINLVTPYLITSFLSESQSHLPDNSFELTPHISNWKIPFDNGEPLNEEYEP